MRERGDKKKYCPCSYSTDGRVLVLISIVACRHNRSGEGKKYMKNSKHGGVNLGFWVKGTIKMERRRKSALN